MTVIVGNASAKMLIGSACADIFSCYRVDDRIDGDAGDDLIDGGYGNDSIDLTSTDKEMGLWLRS